jgi:uncharacterized protein YeaO (DUF488 family)
MAKQTKKPRIQIKRAYAPPSPGDGVRILVDRIWPRGVRKADAAIGRWLKVVAPGSELRRWFGHEPARWDEFKQRDEAELGGKAGLLGELRKIAEKEPLTLVYSAQDETHNQAAVLRDVLTA